MIDIERTTKKKYQNCNSCGAVNYESELSTNRVKYLTYISVGYDICNTVYLRLCDECLKVLCQQIKVVVDNIKSDK